MSIATWTSVASYVKWVCGEDVQGSAMSSPNTFRWKEALSLLRKQSHSAGLFRFKTLYLCVILVRVISLLRRSSHPPTRKSVCLCEHLPSHHLCSCLVLRTRELQIMGEKSIDHSLPSVSVAWGYKENFISLIIYKQLKLINTKKRKGKISPTSPFHTFFSLFFSFSFLFFFFLGVGW